MKIRCAICNQQVAIIETYHDPRTDVRHIRVYCHGDMDEMSLTQREFLSLSLDEPGGLEQLDGVAFSDSPMLQE